MVMDAGRLAELAEREAVDLVEIFASVQGEGPHMGEFHVFLRFAHCDIHCAYCDTPACHAVPAAVSMADAPEGVPLENPVAARNLDLLLDAALRAPGTRALSITGGEPLLQPWGVTRAARAARRAGVPALLETDANLPDALKVVIEDIDILSLDWKLPSATGEPATYDAHRRCLELSAGRECYVKAVFTGETPVEEVLLAARAVAELRPEALLVLQPCTPFGRVREGPPAHHVSRLLREVSRVHANVRVLPQMHKMIGLP